MSAAMQLLTFKLIQQRLRCDYLPKPRLWVRVEHHVVVMLQHRPQKTANLIKRRQHQGAEIVRRKRCQELHRERLVGENQSHVCSIH